MNRLLSILLALALVVSLSVTAFADGEQPGGTSYPFVDATGSWGLTNYWTATSTSLRSIYDVLNNIYSQRSTLNDIQTSNNSIVSKLGTVNTSNTVLYFLKELYTQSVDSEVKFRLLLANLGTPSSGSTFWSNALANKQNTDTLVDRTSSLDASYNFVNSSGTQSSSKATWWNAVNSSLLNTGSITIALQRHIDSDFHSLHDKIGTAIDDGSTLFSLLTDLHTVFASPEDLEMHNNNSDNYAQANDDFFTGQDSSTSIGTGSLSGLKDFGSSAGLFLGTNGVSPTEVFTIISDGTSSGGFEKPWVWFEQGNKIDLEETIYDGNGNLKNSNLKSRSNSNIVFDLYSEHQKEFYSALGGLTDG